MCAKDCSQADPHVREAVARAKAERKAALNAVASQIHSEVDRFVTSTIRPNSLNPHSIEKDLQQILGNAEEKSPSAFVMAEDGAPALVIAYTLQKGPQMGIGSTSVTLRAYTAKQGGFQLSATTGEDMDGYAGISIIRLHSPVPHELWLLLSGQLTGANGPNVRMRLYACDRTGFRTPWAPENVWGTFKIHLTNGGFTVDGNYYRENKTRHDIYSVAEDGVYRAFQ